MAPEPEETRTARINIGSRLMLGAVMACALLALAVASVLVVRARHTERGGAAPSIDLAPSGGETPRAVIVDQISERWPNPAFVMRMTAQLQDAGYEVDYVPAARVGVDFYRDLPGAGYRLVILRSHSARRVVAGEKSDSATLFTNEAPDADHPLDELVAHRLGVVQYDDGPGEHFIGVRPEFIEQDARGEFDSRTLVVLMGCDGARSDRLARAFIRRGAAAFVSWDDIVTVPQTDAATEDLLARLLAGDTSLPDAVSATMAALGRDPLAGARLAYFAR